jgi:hypothetical protein
MIPSFERDSLLDLKASPLPAVIPPTDDRDGDQDSFQTLNMSAIRPKHRGHVLRSR